MSPRIALVSDWYFLQDGSRLGTGGTETYIGNLAQLAHKLGYDVGIFQRGAKSFANRWNEFSVRSWTSFDQQYQLLRTFHGGERGPTVYSDLHLMPPRLFRPAVGIQHGIYWDIRFRRFRSDALQWILNWLKGARAVMWSRRCLRAIQALDAVVTVDSNFQNWMRTMCGWHDFERKWEYIPNFAEPVGVDQLRAKLNDSRRVSRILFARRLVPHRGTFLWAEAVRRLAAQFPQIEFVFCGRAEGVAVRQKLEEVLRGLGNVRVYERAYNEMQQEHYFADIEVVPSYGSEGTAFSLIEAMASGTCVVATCVGGLPNIVIPDFNGVIVEPVESRIEQAVTELIQAPEKVRRLASNAYQTVLEGFSKLRWQERMTELFGRVFGMPAREVSRHAGAQVGSAETISNARVRD